MAEGKSKKSIIKAALDMYVEEYKENNILVAEKENTDPPPIKFRALKKEIDECVERERGMQEKLKCLTDAEDALGFFGGNKKRIIKKKKESLEKWLGKLHNQMIYLWRKYDKCPISIKTALTPVGETVCFGSYPCFEENYRYPVSRIQWKVLSKSNGTAVLVSHCCIDVATYSSTKYEEWENSALRRWCQDLYDNHFTDDERKYICDLSINSNNGVKTRDKIVCLSANDVKCYMPTEESRYTTLTPYAKHRFSIAWDVWDDFTPRYGRTGGWWLRDCNSDGKTGFCILDQLTTEHNANRLGIPINYSRKIYSGASRICPMGVRPALVLKLE